MVPSCMSSLRLGSMIEMVGSVEKSAVGKLLNGRFELAGMLLKFTQGACFSA